MRFAVLGLSSAGSRHASYLVELGHEVVAFDPDPATAYTEVRAARTAEEAIDFAEAVVVASPSSFHGAQALAALERGRHVLVEKPLADSVTQAAALVELSESSGLTCAVAMNMRFHRAITKLRQILGEGVLGTPYLAAASFGYDLRKWRPEKDYRSTYSGRADLGGGIVLDGIHELDYLIWLLGPVESVSADVGRLSDLEIDVEDIALATVRFRSGALGCIDLNYLDPAYRRRCLFVGSHASADWDWVEGRIVLRAGGHHDEPGASETIDVAVSVDETYRLEMDDFVRALVAGTPPRTTAADALHAVMLADAIKESAASGRRVRLASP